MKPLHVRRLGYLQFAAVLVGLAWIFVAVPWPAALAGLAIFGSLGYVTGRATLRLTYLRRTLGVSLSSPSYRRRSNINAIVGLLLLIALGAAVFAGDWLIAFVILINAGVGVALGTGLEVLHQQKVERLAKPVSLNTDVETAVVAFLAGHRGYILRDSEVAVLMRSCAEISWKGGVRAEHDRFALIDAFESPSFTEEENRSLSQMSAQSFVGFFHAATQGLALVDIRLVRQRFDFSVEENYPEASLAFLNFSRTYWTLKAVIQEAEENNRHNAALAMLARLDEHVGPLFFPFFTPPGLPILDPMERERDQRKFLAAFAPNIDVEAFMQGNPILIRGQRLIRNGERQAMSKIELDSYISRWFEERGRGP